MKDFAVVTDCRTYFATSVAANVYGWATGGTVEVWTKNGWKPLKG
jgi:hypothetical protein